MNKIHALDTIKESGKLLGRVPMKATRHWSWRPDSEAIKQSILQRSPKVKEINGRHLSKWTPKVVQPDSKAVKVVGFPDCKATVKQTVKRFPVEIVDRATGERRKVWTRLITNEVKLQLFGNQILFTKTNRTGRVKDSRDGKMKTLDIVRDELIRLLGIERAKIGIEALQAE